MSLSLNGGSQQFQVADFTNFVSLVQISHNYTGDDFAINSSQIYNYGVVLALIANTKIEYIEVLNNVIKIVLKKENGFSNQLFNVAFSGFAASTAWGNGEDFIVEAALLDFNDPVPTNGFVSLLSGSNPNKKTATIKYKLSGGNGMGSSQSNGNTYNKAGNFYIKTKVEKIKASIGKKDKSKPDLNVKAKKVKL